MLKSILKFLLWLLIILLVCAGVIGYYIWKGKPVGQALLVLAALAVLVVLFLVIRRLWIRHRAKKQVQKMISEEKVRREGGLDWSPRALRRDLKSRWQGGIKALKRSRLRLLGDPMYVLPWYVVMGRSSSGKSTAVKNAYLLSPVLDLPERQSGSTRNLDWWMYEEAVVIDTAGRYAVPDDPERDRNEWDTLMALLSRRKQKEPLNGILVVVSADRLLNASADDLLEEGKQVRASLGHLMNTLAAQVPVYLLVTKCDLIEGFTQFCEALPEESWQQVMGALNDQRGADVLAALDQCLEKLNTRLKDLRLLLVERSKAPSVEMMFFPDALYKLRDGLRHFADGTLRGSPYLETPYFRGLFLSSSQQALGGVQGSGLKDRGLFLHDLFTKVMPADRGLLVTLPAAERVRRSLQHYWIGIAGGLLAAAGLVTSFLFLHDYGALHSIGRDTRPVVYSQTDVNQQVAALGQVDTTLNDLEEAHDGWLFPWYAGLTPPQLDNISAEFQQRFQDGVLKDMDRRLKERLALISPGDPAIQTLAEGLARRSLILQARIADADADDLHKLAPVPTAYWKELQPVLTDQGGDELQVLYAEYESRVDYDEDLRQEQGFVSGELVELLQKTSGDYTWLLNLANHSPDLKPVSLEDFWSGTHPLADPPQVQPAFTADGFKAIKGFTDELQQATGNATSGPVPDYMDRFYDYYQDAYVDAWKQFADRFDEGSDTLADRSQWLAVVGGLGESDPYLKLLDRMHEELAPLDEDAADLKTSVDYYHEVATYAPASTTKAAAAQSGGFGKALAGYGVGIIAGLSKEAKEINTQVKKIQKLNKKPKPKRGKKVKDLETAISDAAKANEDYEKAITLMAFNSDNASESYANVAAWFGNPDKVAASGTSGGNGWAAIQALQLIMGKPDPETEPFWKLYTGPLRLLYQFMQQETACYLNQQWSANVLTQTEGVEESKLPQLLIGKSGLVWSYTSKTAAPFLSNKYQAGYVAVRADDHAMPFTPGFMSFLNHALEGAQLVDGTQTVTLSTLPTNVNSGAKLLPSNVMLTLQCADGVQELDNYNFKATQAFNWSVAGCGDTVLRIFLGPLVLTRVYAGIKGFPQFLADFKDGEHVFGPADFPDDREELMHDGVSAIRVRYSIGGQRPVLLALKAVPLDAPQQVAECWAPGG
ncbi:MAG TPA: type VI secretion protein IcmF/TssM N-terminal domain-containing protein [Gammaproteobacteria bacterium]|nr:type VI secretion protein IcmF/TssM N-terminal domain-containing protein [Gammaproteobacteria bacterium]